MTRCMRPVRRLKKASFRAAASPCSVLPSSSRACAPRTTTRRPASRSCARRCPWPARQIAINAGEDGSVIVGKILENKAVRLRLRLADRRIRRPRQEGHHRPDQGGSCGDPERGLGRGSADHHRSHGGRTAEEERRAAAAACPRAAAWAAWTSKSSRFRRSSENAKPRQRCRGFCLVPNSLTRRSGKRPWREPGIHTSGS